MLRLITAILIMMTCFSNTARSSSLDLDVVAPFDAELKYPFTKEASVGCGRWGKGSQDYPYFAAPRNKGRRRHAGVDLYPAGGAGTVVVAMRGGVVTRVAPFYRRANGEMTYAVLVDHGDFSINYAELKRPGLHPGTEVKQGQPLGQISGTRQLHLEMYAGGAKTWTSGWYGAKPGNLLDPTSLLLQLYQHP